MDGVQLPQDHFEEAVYFLPLNSQILYARQGVNIVPAFAIFKFKV